MKKLLLIVILYLPSTFAISQTITFNYSGSNEKIIKALTDAKKILDNPSFYTKIDAIKKFNHTYYSGKRISNEIKTLNKVIKITEFTNYNTKTTARTQYVITLNNAKLSRTHASIIDTIIHETVHFVDYAVNKKYDYTHKSQKRNKQSLGSAPYVIGRLANKMLTKN